ncbi:MAG: iron-sulfur cluster assembly scaffold protein [Lentihominibacter sp.]
MRLTKQLEEKIKVNTCHIHGAAPIPQEGRYSTVIDVKDLSGFSHSVGTCGLKQGACKLSLNIKDGIIQEALIEVIGCTGMTHSAAMAAEILPGKTLLEALNTDLVCDAINVAMREFFLAMCYGRTQTAYSKDGLCVGAGMEDLGIGARSQVGTCYGTVKKGPRYLELTEGYILRLALDKEDRIIGYRYVNFGKMMNLIEDGQPAKEAITKATSTYGRFDEAVKVINPRRE